MNKSLKWFLVERFLIALIFIALSQELIGIVYRKFLPGLFVVLHINEVGIESEGSILLLMLQIVLYVCAGLLPDEIARLIQYKLQQIMAGAWQLRIDTSAIPMADSDKWEGFYQFGVILIFLVLFAITLLPYVLAIMWYYIQISHKLEELLQQEKEQKKAYDKARNLMLSDITHDIKTPITTICGYAKTLTDGVIPLSEEKRQEYLQAIYVKSMRMSELVTMLFEYIKMDSEGFTLHKEKTDVCELLREVIAMMYTDFEEKGMELEIEIPDKLDSIELDKSQMTRVITNILNNALKYMMPVQR